MGEFKWPIRKVLPFVSYDTMWHEQKYTVTYTGVTYCRVLLGAGYLRGEVIRQKKHGGEGTANSDERIQGSPNSRYRGEPGSHVAATAFSA